MEQFFFSNMEQFIFSNMERCIFSNMEQFLFSNMEKFLSALLSFMGSFRYKQKPLRDSMHKRTNFGMHFWEAVLCNHKTTVIHCRFWRKIYACGCRSWAPCPATWAPSPGRRTCPGSLRRCGPGFPISPTPWRSRRPGWPTAWPTSRYSSGQGSARWWW